MEALVDASSESFSGRSSSGNLLREWPAELGNTNAIFEADGRLFGLIGAGNPSGVSSAVSQPIQRDRAVLVSRGANVGWFVAE